LDGVLDKPSVNLTTFLLHILSWWLKAEIALYTIQMSPATLLAKTSAHTISLEIIELLSTLETILMKPSPMLARQWGYLRFISWEKIA